MDDPSPSRSVGAARALAFVEFSSEDPAATRSFLERVFGWSFRPVEMPQGEYLAFETGDGGRGGLRPTRTAEPPGSLSYVRVEDLEAAREAVRRAGGELVLPRVDIPGMGSFFWFKVPRGPTLACWQDAPPTAERNTGDP